MRPAIQRALVLVAVFAAFLAFVTRKVLTWGKAPSASKDCLFAYPPQPLPSPVRESYPEDIPTTFRFSQTGGFLNDASCLNRTVVRGVVQPTNEDELRKVLAYADVHELPVSMAGARHSMGGQSIAEAGIVLDMMAFKKIEVNEETKMLHVQSGATWEQVQEALDPLGLSVSAMQSINIFTVGGTLSVNAHGIAHTPGQVASTVESMRIMLADGSVVQASRTENAELFHHALGGYGLFGIILDADIRLTKNELYARENKTIPVAELPGFIKETITENQDYGLFYARLSVSPLSYLSEASIHAYKRVPGETADIPPLHADTHTWLNRVVINASKTGGLGRFVRWTLEQYVEPKFHSCLTSRNIAMSQKEVCLVSRNQEMSDSMSYLKNTLPDTDILQEYFVPPEQFPAFVDGLREIMKRHDVNLLNVTVRLVSKDEDTVLAYAPEDRMALVLYFNQKLNAKESEALRTTTPELIDLATRLGGTFYLPYRLDYTKEQLRAAYPMIETFFETKRAYDPDARFQNAFYRMYAGE